MTSSSCIILYVPFVNLNLKPYNIFSFGVHMFGQFGFLVPVVINRILLVFLVLCHGRQLRRRGFNWRWMVICFSPWSHSPYDIYGGIEIEFFFIPYSWILLLCHHVSLLILGSYNRVLFLLIFPTFNIVHPLMLPGVRPHEKVLGSTVMLHGKISFHLLLLLWLLLIMHGSLCMVLLDVFSIHLL